MTSFPVVNAFLETCKTCSHGNDAGRCFFRSPAVTNSDMLSAWCGNAQERPTSRNYAARLALTLLSRGVTLNPDSSWVETWKGLGAPCPEYKKS